MAKTENVSSDYTTLSEMSESVTFFAKIIERGDGFTVAKTATALYTIPNDGIISVSPSKGQDEEVSRIRVKQDVKIVQKTLVSAARIAGIRSIIANRGVGGVNLCEQCCEQCCNQCCEQCCEHIIYQMFDPAVIAAAASTAFRRALR